ncbi:hypothetical protein IW262DRAFT_1461977 [Armillaria fumosa]|nr:hypothetical protein IW262DRAFT_1461977 [Armillaria fumosa]
MATSLIGGLRPIVVISMPGSPQSYAFQLMETLLFKSLEKKLIHTLMENYDEGVYNSHPEKHPLQQIPPPSYMERYMSLTKILMNLQFFHSPVGQRIKMLHSTSGIILASLRQLLRESHECHNFNHIGLFPPPPCAEPVELHIRIHIQQTPFQSLSIRIAELEAHSLQDVQLDGVQLAQLAHDQYLHDEGANSMTEAATLESMQEV